MYNDWSRDSLDLYSSWYRDSQEKTSLDWYGSWSRDSLHDENSLISRDSLEESSLDLYSSESVELPGGDVIVPAGVNTIIDSLAKEAKPGQEPQTYIVSSISR